MKQRIPLILLSGIIICGAGYAKTIGFACMYNSEAPTGAVEIITALETELFELCFDRGLIATSVEYITGTFERYKNNVSLVKRFDSSIDYLVAIYCEYGQHLIRKSNNAESAIDWKKLHWKIIDFSSQATLMEEIIEPETIPETEPKKKAKKAGEVIGTVMLQKL